MAQASRSSQTYPAHKAWTSEQADCAACQVVPCWQRLHGMKLKGRGRALSGMQRQKACHPEHCAVAFPAAPDMLPSLSHTALQEGPAGKAICHINICNAASIRVLTDYHPLQGSHRITMEHAFPHLSQ